MMKPSLSATLQQQIFKIEQHNNTVLMLYDFIQYPIANNDQNNAPQIVSTEYNLLVKALPLVSTTLFCLLDFANLGWKFIELKLFKRLLCTALAKKTLKFNCMLF